MPMMRNAACHPDSPSGAPPPAYALFHPATTTPLIAKLRPAPMNIPLE